MYADMLVNLIISTSSRLDKARLRKLTFGRLFNPCAWHTRLTVKEVLNVQLLHSLLNGGIQVANEAKALVGELLSNPPPKDIPDR